MQTRTHQHFIVLDRPGRGQVVIGVFSSERNAAHFRDTHNRNRERDSFGPFPFAQAVIRKASSADARRIASVAGRAIATDETHKAPHPNETSNA